MELVRTSQFHRRRFCLPHFKISSKDLYLFDSFFVVVIVGFWVLGFFAGFDTLCLFVRSSGKKGLWSSFPKPSLWGSPALGNCVVLF